MTVSTAQRPRTVAARKMLAKLKTMGTDELGRIKVGTFSMEYKDPISQATPSFWTFWFNGCEEVSVYVCFDPHTEEFTLIGKGRCKTNFFVTTLPDGRKFNEEGWPEIEHHYVHIDDLVDHRLKQPMMVALGLKEAPKQT